MYLCMHFNLLSKSSWIGHQNFEGVKIQNLQMTVLKFILTSTNANQLEITAIYFNAADVFRF